MDIVFAQDSQSSFLFCHEIQILPKKIKTEQQKKQHMNFEILVQNLALDWNVFARKYQHLISTKETKIIVLYNNQQEWVFLYKTCPKVVVTSYSMEFHQSGGLADRLGRKGNF